MKFVMSRESSLSETSCAIAFVASAFAMSALTDSIFFCVSFTLAVRSVNDAVFNVVVDAVVETVVNAVVDCVADAVDAVFGVVVGGGGVVFVACAVATDVFVTGVVVADVVGFAGFSAAGVVTEIYNSIRAMRNTNCIINQTCEIHFQSSCPFFTFLRSS